MIRSLDHLVLTVADLDRCVAFYTALGMTKVVFGGDRIALTFGAQKINLHLSGHEFEPKAQSPQPGSADLCFLLGTPLDDAVAVLKAMDVRLEEGPVQRTGATGPIRSVYCRDPDGNLIELSVAEDTPPSL